MPYGAPTFQCVTEAIPLWSKGEQSFGSVDLFEPYTPPLAFPLVDLEGIKCVLL